MSKLQLNYGKPNIHKSTSIIHDLLHFCEYLELFNNLDIKSLMVIFCSNAPNIIRQSLPRSLRILVVTYKYSLVFIFLHTIALWDALPFSLHNCDSLSALNILYYNTLPWISIYPLILLSLCFVILFGYIVSWHVLLMHLALCKMYYRKKKKTSPLMSSIIVCYTKVVFS